MILPIIASLLLYQVLGDPIVGGQFSPIHKYPWLASIQREDRHKCGGSIISSNTILTAAHCANYPPESYVVRVGSERTDSGGTWHTVVAIKQHENYNMSVRIVRDIRDDVALMKVSPPIELGRYGALIQLPRKGYVVPVGTNVSVVGWRSMSAEGNMVYELRSVGQHIVGSRECANMYGDHTGMRMKTRHQICASESNSGFCFGDSGGPLVTKDDVQVGIVFASYGCGEWGYPGIYQDVAYYRDWIDANSKDFEACYQTYKPQIAYPAFRIF